LIPQIQPRAIVLAIEQFASAPDEFNGAHEVRGEKSVFLYPSMLLHHSRHFAIRFAHARFVSGVSGLFTRSVQCFRD